jgi:hypothetical protein
VGIVSAFGPEQAAILAEMHVQRHAGSSSTSRPYGPRVL